MAEPDLEEDIADVVERELDLRAEMPFVQSEAQLHQLLAIAHYIDFSDGDRLFEQGAPIDRIFLITQGTVEMVAEGLPSWRLVGSGGVGFLDFMMGRPHARSAIARGEVRELEIDASDYREWMQDNIDLAQQVLAQLSTTIFDEILRSRDPAALLRRASEGTPISDGGDPTLVDRLLLLSRVPAFARASVQALANLAQNARVLRYAAGREILTAGVRYETLNVLIRGEVELHRLGAPPIRRGPCDLLSHIAELSTDPRRVSVRAVEEVLVLQIDREELLDRMDEHFEVAQSLFAHVASQRELLNDVAAEAGETL